MNAAQRAQVRKEDCYEHNKRTVRSEQVAWRALATKEDDAENWGRPSAAEEMSAQNASREDEQL
jgi:hypothetical protein